VETRRADTNLVIFPRLSPAIPDLDIVIAILQRSTGTITDRDVAAAAAIDKSLRTNCGVIASREV
jgi:hypothetical protein